MYVCTMYMYIVRLSPEIQSQEWYNFSYLFWSKIKGFVIPVYISLTTSKGNEDKLALYCGLGETHK